MKKILLILTLAGISFHLAAEESCEERAKISALEEVTKILLGDWKLKKSIGSTPLVVKIGKPRTLTKQNKKILRIAVPFDIGNSSFEQLFHFDQKCKRDLNSEREAAAEAKRRIDKREKLK